MNDDEFHVIGVTTDFFWWLLHARLDSYGVYTGKENLSVSFRLLLGGLLNPL